MNRTAIVAGIVFSVCAAISAYAAEVPPVLRKAIDQAKPRRADVTRVISYPDKSEYQRIRTRIGDRQMIQERTWLEPDAILPENRETCTRVLRGPDFAYTLNDGVISGSFHEGHVPNHLIESDPLMGPLGESEEKIESYETYRCANEDGLAVVRAEQVDEQGALIQTAWWMDPQKDGVVVRYERRINEGGGLRVVTKYIQRRGRWVPDESRRYAGAKMDNLWSCTRYENVEVDAERLPAEFTPTDIGIEVGTQLIHITQDRTPKSHPLVWDGTKPAPMGEVVRKVKAGELRYGPGVELRHLIASASESACAAPRSGWDANIITHDSENWGNYAEAFIRRYKLDAGQAGKARALAEECRAAADNHLRRSKAAFDIIAVELRDPALAVEARKRELRLIAPLDEIFFKQLREPLYALLTDDQRKVDAKLAADVMPPNIDRPAR